MTKKTPAWGSKGMAKAIRKHDRQFARKYGGGARPTRGGCVLVLLAVAAGPVAAVAAVRGWA